MAVKNKKIIQKKEAKPPKDNLNNSDKPTNQIISASIKDEMASSYIDYAMSVIVARALPDVRDGLKPVHRRILYAMWKLGLKAQAKFRKSATVVGEVLGKYHPHGDMAVYDSMVRMAQEFSMRYPLINGQGNFGSIDGDSAAAMRYTEAKLNAISEELLLDLNKETINFIPNYDGSQEEPQVLPGELPNLLLNGSMGIAVGMATNIPPHNLTEICQALIYLIDQPQAELNDLMQYVKGPDFPTGGIIFDPEQIKHVYATGKGGIITRAKTEIIEDGKDFSIIVSEIPYQVNKSSLLEKIAELVKDKKIEGIQDLRDESDRQGLRIVVKLKRNSFPQKILNQLFRMTQLQDTFYVNMIALIDGIQPKLLNLKGILEEYIKHRVLMVERRIKFDLKQAKDRAHLLEGLKIALDNIDAIVKIIKKSKNKDEAKKNLRHQFKFSIKQVDAILEMRLHQLVNLERIAILNELKEKKELIKKLEEILKSQKKILAVIKTELEELIQKYGDERRTFVAPYKIGEFKQEDVVPKELCVILTTKDGYIKRLPPQTFKKQIRGGKGVIGLTPKEEDAVDLMFTTNTHSDLLFFTTSGKVFQLKAYNVPVASRTARGQALVNFLQTSSEEKVSAIMPISEEKKEKKYLVMATQQGLIKKVEIEAFKNLRRSGLIALKLKPDDILEWVKTSDGQDEIMLVSRLGQAIRFKEKDVRSMGRTAAGVRGIKLRKGDQVISMDVIDAETKSKTCQVLVVSQHGYGKKTDLNQYKIQGRGGVGIKTVQVTDKIGPLVSASLTDERNLPEGAKGDLILVSEKGQVIRLPLKSVSTLGRATQGVCLMRFKEKGDRVASVTLV
ncbi:MAG: DNA gyrase subunit A [Patescibacteria group bacterium]|nr:DNA gyrase subunit A [Patescibacteria group bacterium]